MTADQDSVKGSARPAVLIKRCRTVLTERYRRIAIVALTVLSFAVHVLFSPWLLVAVAILARIKFRPRRSHR